MSLNLETNRAAASGQYNPVIGVSRSYVQRRVSAPLVVVSSSSSGDRNAAVLMEINLKAVDPVIESDSKASVGGGVEDVYGEDSATEEQNITPWTVSVASGYSLMRDPHHNKGLAFSEKERDAHYLRGLLPPVVVSQDLQVKKLMNCIRNYQVPLQKYMAMMDYQEHNERLFYKLLIENVEELLPIGLYFSLKEKGKILEVLKNWPQKKIQVIVVTDGERILGLGDLGCQGMGIPVGKLSLYTALGGIRPSACLPVTIDVGTNNEDLLNDEFYIGLRQRRATGQEYAELLHEFMSAVKQNYGEKVLIQYNPVIGVSRSYVQRRVSAPLVVVSSSSSGDRNAAVLMEINLKAVDPVIESDSKASVGGGVEDVYGEDSATEEQNITPWTVSVASGYSLMRDPHHNKGLAFSEKERDAHYLRGLLPPVVVSQDLQVKKLMNCIRNYQVPLQKYMAMMDYQEHNERLFYKLLIENVEELLPIGLYFSLKEKGKILEVLKNWPQKKIQVIVVTDGERILGLGDLGCQGMGIPVGKLSLYTALGGIRPSACLPVTIDVGTNNEDLLNDEFYIGLRQRRATGQEYAELLHEFMSAVKQNYGEKVLIQYNPVIGVSRSYVQRRVSAPLVVVSSSSSGDRNAAVLMEINLKAVDPVIESDSKASVGGGVEDVYGEDSATEEQNITPWTVSVASGYSLMRDPHHNKGLAFSEKERDAHYLRGLLPPVVVSQDLQVKKLMNCIRNYQVPLQKYMAMMDYQTCRCHGMPLDDIHEHKNKRSCPLTCNDLESPDIFDNYVKVGEQTVLFMPSFWSTSKLQQVSSPVDFKIIERPNSASLSESEFRHSLCDVYLPAQTGVIFGPSYVVTPSSCPESEDVDKSELNAQSTFRKGLMHLRRVAGLEEVLPTLDVHQLITSSAAKRLKALYEPLYSNLQFGLSANCLSSYGRPEPWETAYFMFWVHMVKTCKRSLGSDKGKEGIIVQNCAIYGQHPEFYEKKTTPINLYSPLRNYTVYKYSEREDQTLEDDLQTLKQYRTGSNAPPPFRQDKVHEVVNPKVKTGLRKAPARKPAESAGVSPEKKARKMRASPFNKKSSFVMARVAAKDSKDDRV
ncbi:hypothetical protein POM88_051567 [Heracleum sosnowskyi]|uniref:Malic enzyme N-terminal domain-containing protein n=1 Tax=Heracleum sosnowskyi TaxID=360622 RepID=A0AAD8H0P8_9APIA|nr:hypothetical protein POM88_051567 [Heracleum sosnowskyi]